jgi:hypothetical protein
MSGDKKDDLLEEVMGDEFSEELQNASFSEYFLKKKHQIENFSLYEEKTSDRNPFEFEAFASINKIAKVFNYDVFAVSELTNKDNPFQSMNKDISTEIKSKSNF